MTHAHRKPHVPFLLWPFWALWRFVRLMLELTGRVLGIVIGFVLIAVGVLLSLTIVGAIVGIPLASLGALLIIRGLF